MKKIKVLTSLVGLTGLSMGLVPTIASCGCSTNSYKVEMVSKQKEREFNNKTGGSSYTFKLADAATAKATKVKMINLKVDGAETKTVAGLLKTNYDSAGNIKVTVKTNMLLTQWPEASKFEFSLLFTNKENGETATVDGFSLTANKTPSIVLEVISFENCEWNDLEERTKLLYNKSIEEKQFLDSITINVGGDPVVATSMDDFVGLEREITINSKAHIVRVVDTQHDLLVEQPTGETEVKAVFTFEFVNILTGNDGEPMKMYWAGVNTKNCRNYLSGDLHTALNSDADLTTPWQHTEDTTNNKKSVKTMLAQANIHPIQVRHKVNTSESYYSPWNATICDEFVFVNSAIGLMGDAIQKHVDINWETYGSTYNQEGETQYKFYKEHLPISNPYAWDGDDTAKLYIIKFCVGKTDEEYGDEYHIRSPHIQNPSYCFSACGGGYISCGSNAPNYDTAVAPMFCI